MSQNKLWLPKDYRSRLDVMQTEQAIKLTKDHFERMLAEKLQLTRVSAPLFVRPETGLNDDLNGVERPVQFDIMDLQAEVQIVHSLAKWKRLALKRYGFTAGTGLYTDMNAIRRDEELDNLHSVYVDQWDWEKIITPQTRTTKTLCDTVRQIVDCLKQTETLLCHTYPQLKPFLRSEVFFITSQELEDRFPDKTPKEREDAICREHGIVFIMQIGGALKSGQPHDKRAPDYDDWSLNGDLLVWYPVLEHAIELSSMGIRVDVLALARQLEIASCESRKNLPFHQALLNNELPLTMGGGIGQSRICMLLLQKAHIGEVQASVWSDEMLLECDKHGIHLL
ncbi:MAG: aspartate--ammonia ligase [Clostridiales bacterium]|nr:aspartate--ammonia ligase [Clostridiales bacterium]